MEINFGSTKALTTHGMLRVNLSWVVRVRRKNAWHSCIRYLQFAEWSCLVYCRRQNQTSFVRFRAFWDECFLQLGSPNFDHVLDWGWERGSQWVAKNDGAFVVSGGLVLLVSLVWVAGQHVEQSECLLSDHFLGRLHGLVLSLTHRLVGHADSEPLLVKWDCVFLWRIFDHAKGD